jgi:hypothetical protein
MGKRLQVRVSDETAEKVLLWAGKLGVSASQLGGMAVMSGIDAIIRAVSPMESISPEVMVKWAREYEKSAQADQPTN